MKLYRATCMYSCKGVRFCPVAFFFSPRGPVNAVSDGKTDRLDPEIVRLPGV